MGDMLEDLLDVQCFRFGNRYFSGRMIRRMMKDAIKHNEKGAFNLWVKIYSSILEINIYTLRSYYRNNKSLADYNDDELRCMAVSKIRRGNYSDIHRCSDLYVLVERFIRYESKHD